MKQLIPLSLERYNLSGITNIEHPFDLYFLKKKIYNTDLTWSMLSGITNIEHPFDLYFLKKSYNTDLTWSMFKTCIAHARLLVLVKAIFTKLLNLCHAQLKT